MYFYQEIMLHINSAHVHTVVYDLVALLRRQRFLQRCIVKGSRQVANSNVRERREALWYSVIDASLDPRRNALTSRAAALRIFDGMCTR